MKQLGFFIALSIVIHFLVSTTTLYFADRLEPERNRNQTTEIEVIDPDSKKNEQLEKTRQMVKQLKSEVAQYIQSKQARFESEKTQRVEKETKASQFGLTQNASNISSSQNNSKPQQPNSTLEKTKAQKDGDLPEFARFKSGASQIQVSQQSTISNSLPSDIQQSNATNLNTDANTYYSFYNRIEELFYVRWVERNNFHWNRISFEYKKNVLAGKTWSTEVEIWLKSNGEFHSAYIKRQSGYPLFDEAAVFAFKDTKLFPNPPKAKVESDGFVRLRYRFNVNVAAY